jgi:hypothetical protein
MMTKRQLVAAVLVLLAGLAAMNVTVAALTRNSVPRRVMRHARESQTATVVALGNSLVASGFREAAFDSTTKLSAPRGAVSLGLGASTPVEQLLLLRYALAQGMRPQLVIYGFFDFQLTEPGSFSIGDMIGNRARDYYVEPSYGRRFYSLSAHDAVEFRALEAFPMFADRGAIWAKVEILRRAMGQQGLPTQRSNQFGRAADFSLLEAKNEQEFRQKCEDALSQPLSPAVSELLRVAGNAGLSIAVVEMPMRQAHRHAFYDTASWQEYVAHVRKLLAAYPVTFVDASHWIVDDAEFDDPLHLGERGAEEFSRRLGNELRTEMATVPALRATTPQRESGIP